MATNKPFPMPQHRVPTWKEWEAIQAFCEGIRIVDGVGTFARDADGGGTAVDVNAEQVASAQSIQFAVSQATPNTIKVTRNGGIIREPDGTEMVPTISGNPIDGDPVPTLGVISGIVYFHVDNTADPVTIEVENDAMQPDDVWNTDHTALEQAYKRLAEITVDGDGNVTVDAQVTRTSLGYAVGDVVIWGSL